MTRKRAAHAAAVNINEANGQGTGQRLLSRQQRRQQRKEDVVAAAEQARERERAAMDVSSLEVIQTQRVDATRILTEEVRHRLCRAVSVSSQSAFRLRLLGLKSHVRR